MSRPAVIFFVRHPVPGRVKTRLAAGSTPELAANLYRIMVEVLRDRLLPHAGREYDLWLYVTPARSAVEVGAWLLGGTPRKGTRILVQPEGDLAGRLDHAGRCATEAGAGAMLFIGSDCMDLAHEDITGALAELESVDAAIGRATDGGFWLLALRRWMPGLFQGVEYSSPYTYGQLLARLRRYGMPPGALAERTDIDCVEDLARQPEEVKLELRRRAQIAGLAIPPIP